MITLGSTRTCNDVDVKVKAVKNALHLEQLMLESTHIVCMLSFTFSTATK
jgi:hypothetical protein